MIPMTVAEVVQLVCGGVGAAVAGFVARKVNKDSGASKDAATDLKAAFERHEERINGRFDTFDARLTDTTERVGRLERRLSPPGFPRVDPASEPRQRMPSSPDR